MAREYPEFPLVGVAVVVWREDELLLIQRGKAPNQGQWFAPGGLVEVGETIYAAAQREIREECSLEIETPELLTTVDVIERDEEGRIRYHFVLIELLARWRSGTALAGDDAAALRWVALSELEHLPISAEMVAVLQLAQTRITAHHHPTAGRASVD